MGEKQHEYYDGNAVRTTKPARQQPVRRNTEVERKRKTNRRIRRNQERALAFGKVYTMILAVSVLATLAICVYYISAQSRNVAQSHNIASLEQQLNDLKDENNATKERLQSMMDLDRIYKIATEKLGMVYAGDDQIIYYDSASKDYVIEKIEITNSTFQNVLASEKNTTGGGIKVKIKNDAYLTSMGDVIIKNNTFTNNVRDLVLGTNSPGGDATQAETANFDIVLFGNTAMKVVNKSSSEADEANRTEIIDSKYLVELNYYEGTNVEKTEDGTGLVVDASSDDFDIVSSLEELEQNTEVDSLFVDYGSYSITINKEDIKDDLTNTITDLSLSVGQSTTTDGLLEYAKDGNVFIKTNVSGELPATKVVLGLNLIEYANKKVNLYYFNTDTNELEFVNTVTFDENGNADVALEHYSEYVLSLNDLTLNEDIENPSTNDNVITYVVLGIVAVVGIAGTLVYLKKSKLN